MPESAVIDPIFVFNYGNSIRTYQMKTNSEINQIQMNEHEPNPDWFDDFLDDYNYQTPKTGQILQGTIVRIDEDCILIDVGLKRDALVPSKDLDYIPRETLDSLSVSDEVTVSVLQPGSDDKDLLVSLNKGIKHNHWILAEEIMAKDRILELEIVGQNRGGLLVQFNSLRGFLPHSQVPELRRAKDLQHAQSIKNNLIGTSIEVKIIEIDQQRNRLIFSALAALEEQRRLRLQQLEMDQIIEGKIVSVLDFGVFVSLGEIDGLIHISQLDWKRIDDPREEFKVGDLITAKIIDIDNEKERVSLSRKAILPSPWNEYCEANKVGDYVEGVVTKLFDFGAFVKLSEHIDGLIHISELGYSASTDPQAVVKVGETVLLKILKIDPLKERIALSMRQVPLERQIAWAIDHFSQDN